MSKIKCRCGNIISTVTNQHEGLLVSLHEVDNIRSNVRPLNTGRDVLECNKCGRLLVSFPDKHSWKIKSYAPENGEPGNLFNSK